MGLLGKMFDTVVSGAKFAGELASAIIKSGDPVPEEQEVITDPIIRDTNGIVLFPDVNELNKTASHNYSGSSSVYQKCYKSNDSKDDLICKFLKK